MSDPVVVFLLGCVLSVLSLISVLLIDGIYTRLRFHYFKQRKLRPPMRPFIRPLQGCWGVAIGRHEIGIKVKHRG